MIKCEVVESESAHHFVECVNELLAQGYEVVTSSCNSKCYKAILLMKDSEQSNSIFQMLKKCFCK